MQKITPHLWFDKEAREAAEFYTSLFPESETTNVTTIQNTPSGDCDIVSFKLWGQEFQSISAGPIFKFNPAVSFMVNFGPPHLEGQQEAREQLDKVWEKLSDGGTPLMPIDKYPFSERYGWIQDRYGLSWQLILTGTDGEARPPIVPSLLFVGDIAGKAEEAINFYLSSFKNTKQGTVARYPAGQEHDKEGTIMFADFALEDEWFAAMDSAHPAHNFTFNEAVSFMVNCDDQAEIDNYWEKLSAVPQAEQCGWCKDKFGISWQVVPAALGEMMKNGSREQIDRVTQAFMPMKKFDIETLEQAYEGKRFAAKPK
jgi:predicted 3-demethylubiquinone-9 3-methyltransferase (glyoxalase superfamily)